MGTRSDVVLAALADGATNRTDISEATGLEVNAVSQELTMLKQKGLAEKTPDGWVATGGTPGRSEHAAAEPAEAAKPARKVKAKATGGGVGCRAQGTYRCAAGRGVRRLRRDVPEGRRAAARAAARADASGIRGLT